MPEKRVPGSKYLKKWTKIFAKATFRLKRTLQSGNEDINIILVILMSNQAFEL